MDEGISSLGGKNMSNYQGDSGAFWFIMILLLCMYMVIFAIFYPICGILLQQYLELPVITQVMIYIIGFFCFIVAALVFIKISDRR